MIILKFNLVFSFAVGFRTARSCTVSSANTFTDPTAGGDSGNLFQADGLLVEATPLKSILEVKVGGQPPGLLAVRESAQGTCQLVARRWKSARSTTRARCTGLSTSIRVAPTPSNMLTAAPTPSSNLLPRGHPGQLDQNNPKFRSKPLKQLL
ncbi:uncharacterized protein LOC128093120 [Culex pipiens pallens]|uniref:uncharacterized protein LOC128093120 n=1 Tax=Culex pipiens pallens TaxID=42434 RepID=UPI0022AB2C95|nr:uncharacterized protein LOC128093120 [Culex pipiens pallens]